MNLPAKVSRAVDVLIEAAQPYEGLFPSILDLSTHEIPPVLPPKIPGQRNEDRSYPGCNLMHDHALLSAMYDLGRALGRPHYAQAADRYLKRFATHCTDTATGLFPWGEHAFWDFVNDKIGNSFPLAYDWWKETAIHDHLCPAPFWLWEKLYTYNPGCVERFAEGLDYHWKEGEPLEYTRHAHIEVRKRHGREGRSCDFPRHGGFYIMDWSFAYLKTGRADFLAQAKRMLDYWWPRRSPTGMLPLESRTPEHVDVIYNKTSPGQAIQLATSLLETSELLSEREPDLAATMRERGEVYARSFLTLPHDLRKGVFVDCTTWDTGEIVSTASSWGSVYGTGTSAGIGSACIAFHRMTGVDEFLQLALAVGRRYLGDRMPTDAPIPVCDLSAAIGLMSGLHEVTGERAWLDAGLKFAATAVEVYLDGDLPRGAVGIGFYDSQMGAPGLLSVLARIGAIAEGAPNSVSGFRSGASSRTMEGQNPETSIGV